MAIINQSPAAQASASLAGLTIDNISASGIPSRRGRMTVIGGAFAYSNQAAGAQFIAGLVGGTRAATAADASGVWHLDEHIAAVRQGQWPG